MGFRCCNCSIVSKLRIPNEKILIKNSLLISGQESIWELGWADEGSDKAKQVGLCNRPEPRDLQHSCLYQPGLAYLPVLSTWAKNLKSLFLMSKGNALPFTITCKCTLHSQVTLSDTGVILRTEQGNHCHR